ncbi:MAG: helix-turn-helix transcriptional regulator [Clostridia bacterium]|nr:helix-turn-helix transcriptional regulator [Clostridia bacterium]
MSIGSNIKKLRRERDMTQEQLAEFLGITANAVSGWECDRTSPDISQLPVLANLFGVSADVILGINVGSKDARIAKIYDEVSGLWCVGEREKAEKLCREAIAEYPDAYILMEELAHNLSYYDDVDRLEESIMLFERIRTGSTDDNSKNFAIGNLCSLYMRQGKADVAKELAMTIPQPVFTREQCVRMTLRGAEWAENVLFQTDIYFNDFILELRNIMIPFGLDHPLFTHTELLELWQKVIGFMNQFYENGDYGFDEHILIEAHYHMALLNLKLGNSDTALDELESMLKHIKNYDNYLEGLWGNHVKIPKEKQHTSLLAKPIRSDDPRLTVTVSANCTESSAMEYLRKMSDGVFDSIRNCKRFSTVENSLKEMVKE